MKVEFLKLTFQSTKNPFYRLKRGWESLTEGTGQPLTNWPDLSVGRSWPGSHNKAIFFSH